MLTDWHNVSRRWRRCMPANVLSLNPRWAFFLAFTTNTTLYDWQRSTVARIAFCKLPFHWQKSFAGLPSITLGNAVGWWGAGGAELSFVNLKINGVKMFHAALLRCFCKACSKMRWRLKTVFWHCVWYARLNCYLLDKILQKKTWTDLLFLYKCTRSICFLHETLIWSQYDTWDVVLLWEWSLHPRLEQQCCVSSVARPVCDRGIRRLAKMHYSV